VFSDERDKLSRRYQKGHRIKGAQQSQDHESRQPIAVAPLGWFFDARHERTPTRRLENDGGNILAREQRNLGSES
jgi:hypothetical protein